MNFNYGNNSYNFFNNYNTNNIINQQNKNNLNLSQNTGINNYNNQMNTFYQYLNNLNSNALKIQQPYINSFNSNNNINLLNSANIFQLMPNIIKYGFNQPYSFENTKKESKIIHPSEFKSKLYYTNKNNIPKNNSYINEEEDSNERKFMRKMTKAEKIEIDKWFEARKKLYPTKKNIELKKKIGEIKVEKGLVSELELKLRKKVNILKKLNSSRRIKMQNNFKNFMNFKQRKKELLDSKKNSKDKDVEYNNLSHSENALDNTKNENIIEEGEIVEDIKSNNNENNNEIQENKQNFIGKKRERKINNIKKKLGNRKKEKNNENKKENGFKKGFKYKINNLYDELIKKDKIKEQNILLQAIRYLIKVNNE